MTGGEFFVKSKTLPLLNDGGGDARSHFVGSVARSNDLSPDLTASLTERPRVQILLRVLLLK